MPDSPVLTAWNALNTTLKVALAAVVFIGGYLALRGYLPSRTTPADAAHSSGDFQRPAEQSSIPQGKLIVPTGTSPTEYIGKLSLKAKSKYVVTAADTPGTVIEMDKDITVLIPRDDSAPPVSPGDSTVQAVYSEISQPIIEINPGVLVGASVNRNLEPSVYGGMVVIQGWKRIDLGIGLCKDGLGPFLGWEFWREFCLFGQWNIITFNTDKSRFAAGIAYHF